MALTELVFLLVPLLQQPDSGAAPGEVGKFRWPPAVAKTLYYKATLTKERKLPKAVAKAERAARQAAGLFAPSRPPRQRIEMSMDIELAVASGKVMATYATKLGKQSLRMKVRRPQSPRGVAQGTAGAKNASNAATSAVPFLGNNRIGWVWGLPSAKGESGMEVPLAALERRFARTFEKAVRRGVVSEDMRTQFGDHVLPVVWTHPLPCWIGSLVSTLELGGEAVIGGKQLLRDDSQRMRLGYRNTRVDGMWTKASSSGFTLRYKIDVEQTVSQHRDGRPIEGESSKWLFHVEGVATYAFRDQAWESIVETVTAKPAALPAAKLRALHDEVFSGTIKIQRVAAPGMRRTKGDGRGRRKKGSRRR